MPKKIDEYARKFLAENPASLVLHLGCGLDARYDRLQPASVAWIDLDLPDVIEVRRQFFSETDQVRMIASSVTDLGWLEKVDGNGRSVLIIAEGLFMYLNGADVKTLVQTFQGRFPGCHLIFDAFSKMTADRVQRSSLTQENSATVQWGINDPHHLETWADGIQFKEEWAFSEAPEIDCLPFGMRLAFRAAGMFQIARQAHRILYYIL